MSEETRPIMLCLRASDFDPSGSPWPNKLFPCEGCEVVVICGDFEQAKRMNACLLCPSCAMPFVKAASAIEAGENARKLLGDEVVDNLLSRLRGQR